MANSTKLKSSILNKELKSFLALYKSELKKTRHQYPYQLKPLKQLLKTMQNHLNSIEW